MLPGEIQMLLIDKSAVKAAERRAKKEQKIASGAEAQMKVLQYSSAEWRRIFDFVKAKKIISPDEENALRMAVRIPEKLPNMYQCQRLLSVLERAQSEGFMI